MTTAPQKVSRASAAPNAAVPVFIAPGPPDHVFGWPEIAAALIQSKGITTGWWRVGAQLQFAAITARMGEPGQEHNAPAAPTALVGLNGLALFASAHGGDLVFDAGNRCAPVPAGTVAPMSARKPPAAKAAGKKIGPPKK